MTRSRAPGGLFSALLLCACAREPRLVTSVAPAVKRDTPAMLAPKQEPSAVRRIKVLALNDFHGSLEGGLTFQQRPVGGAAVLAAYLRDASRDFKGRELYLFAGDMVGASPPISGLLHDEPTILFLNRLVSESCQGPKVDNANCNGVATLGNHEFDEGVPELRRMIEGGTSNDPVNFVAGYAGARFPYVCANVVDQVAGQSLCRPYVIREIGGVRVGIIGATTRSTPHHVLSSAVQGLRFEEESLAINRAATEIKQQGVRAIFVVIHEGDELEPYEGATRDTAAIGENLAAIVRELDEEIDLVVSGHAHGFTNAYAPNRAKRSVLVTQAYGRGIAYSDIDLALDNSGEVSEKSAKIVMTYGDQVPVTTDVTDVSQLVAETRERLVPIVDAVIGHAAQPLMAKANAEGESLLGSLVADAQRAYFASDIAMTNAGGLRADLPAGKITWGQAYAAQPFNNRLVRIKISGAELKEYLEQQLILVDQETQFNAISGMSYRWDESAPVGKRVFDVRVGGLPLAPKRRYTMTVNAYMALLQGNRAIPCRACEPEWGPNDLEALVDYLKAMNAAYRPNPGRILRVKSKGSK